MQTAARHNAFQSSRLRIGRHSQHGQVYLITAVTRDRQAVFAELHAARTVVRVLRAEQDLSRATTWAFVVMPDHLHWLMQLGDKVSLHRCVQGVKSMVSRQLGRTIWQDGYHDHSVRGDEDLRAMARYLIANPVRAGLVDHVRHYPHWDAIWIPEEAQSSG